MNIIYLVGFIITFFHYLHRLSSSYNEGTDSKGDTFSLLVAGLIATPFALVWPISLPYALLNKNKD